MKWDWIWVLLSRNRWGKGRRRQARAREAGWRFNRNGKSGPSCGARECKGTRRRGSERGRADELTEPLDASRGKGNDEGLSACWRTG